MNWTSLGRREFLASAAAASLLPATSAVEASPASVRAARESLCGASVAVIGAGVFGSWTARALQAAGAQVTLIDAWGAGHSRSSSGGETRLIRTEYRGDPLYTRWSMESLVEWKALANRHEMPLFRETGALYLYPERDPLIDKSLALHDALAIPMELLSPSELAARWDQIDFDGIALGLMQPTMGTLMARRSVEVVAGEFVAAGGRFLRSAVAPPTPDGGPLRFVRTAGGERVHADHFVFACGPWLGRLFPETVGTRILPIRKEVFFFAPDAGDTRFASPALPAWVDVSSPELYYGFPDVESRGFKIALDAGGSVIDPDTELRLVGEASVESVREYLARRFPALAVRPLTETRVCQYEATDNGNFLIDRHPAAANLWIVGGGSGHGFKHGPALGRYVAARLSDGLPVEPRFALAGHGEQARGTQDGPLVQPSAKGE